jgi:hypothetical protein
MVQKTECSLNGPTDDYEIWHGESLSEIQQDKEALYVPRSQALTMLKCASYPAQNLPD